MIRVTLVAVHADSSPLFRSGGSADLWSRTVARHIETSAKSLAPPRRSRARHGTWARGGLAASFYRDGRSYPPLRLITVEVGNTSDHAVYVHNGTANDGTGYIYTRKGWASRAAVDAWIYSGIRPDVPRYYMPVTRIPGRTSYHLRVHGQQANPFLTDGWNLARRRHRSLPRL